jgi:hypothetical protein
MYVANNKTILKLKLYKYKIQQFKSKGSNIQVFLKRFSLANINKIATSKMFRICSVGSVSQHKDPEDPNRCEDDPPKVERSALPLDLTMPRHRRFAGGKASKLWSSGFKDSSKLHPMEGKEISCSTCLDALVKSLISKLPKEPILVLDRFRLFCAIIGRLVETDDLLFSMMRARSRATVADMFIRYVSVIRYVSCSFVLENL